MVGGHVVLYIPCFEWTVIEYVYGREGGGLLVCLFGVCFAYLLLCCRLFSLLGWCGVVVRGPPDFVLFWCKVRTDVCRTFS